MGRLVLGALVDLPEGNENEGPESYALASRSTAGIREDRKEIQDVIKKRGNLEFAFKQRTWRFKQKIGCGSRGREAYCEEAPGGREDSLIFGDPTNIKKIQERNQAK